MKFKIVSALFLLSTFTVSACGQDGIRSAHATIEINVETGRFTLVESASMNGGNVAHVTNIATEIGKEVNQILDAIVGENTVAEILNPDQLRLTYGHLGPEVYFETYEGRETTSGTADAEKKVFNTAIIQTIRKAEISGGNLYFKRALLNSTTLDRKQFDLEIAAGKDYEKYLLSKGIIDAAIKQPLTSKFGKNWKKSLDISEVNGVLRAAESDFYGGAEGFVQSVATRGLLAGRRNVAEFENIDFKIDERDLKITIPEKKRKKQNIPSVKTFALPGFLNLKGDPNGWTGYWRNRGHDSTENLIHLVGPKLNQSNSSNDIIIGDENPNTVSGGLGNDWIDGGLGADKINGGGGNDVLIGGAGDDILSGGLGDDLLFAGADVNEISGNQGNDRLFLTSKAGRTMAFGGDDNDTFFVQKIITEDVKSHVLDGGSGSDTISFEHYSEAVDLELNGKDQIVSLATETLILENIENLAGSRYSESLTGDSRANILIGHGGNDVINGKEGDDIIQGGAGADTLTGGAGIDTLSYENSLSGVDVSLEYETPHAFGGDASGDRFEDKFENLTGSTSADVLEGNRADNLIKSGRGDDYIIATNGSDEYRGGEGFDTVDYGNHTGDSGLTLNADKPITGYIYELLPAAGQHFLRDIEHIVGTTHADDIIFGKGNHVLEGGKGDDRLTGGDGDDIYFVEIEGGHDKVFENGNEGRDTIMIGFEKDLSWNHISFTMKDRTLKIFYNETQIATAINAPYKGADFREIGVEVLDLGGVGQVEINFLELENQGAASTSGADKIKGHDGVSNLLIGRDGDDEIWGGSSPTQVSDKGNLFHGGRGNDKIFTGNGDDKYLFDRGSEFDTITDLGGNDHIYFGPQVKKSDLIFETVGRDIYIGIKPRKRKSRGVFSAMKMDDKIRIVNGAYSSSKAIESYTVENKKFEIP